MLRNGDSLSSCFQSVGISGHLSDRDGLSRECIGVSMGYIGFSDAIPPIIQNQGEKRMDNEMEARTRKG